MFEEYSTDKLYKCTISDMLPYVLENLGGCISITGKDCGDYSTVVYEQDGKYIDVNNPSRVINVVNTPAGNIPVLSKDYHLYSLDEETLRKYKSDAKVLKRVPFVTIK